MTVFDIKMVPGEEVKYVFAVIPLKAGIHEFSLVSVKLGELDLECSNRRLFVRDSECFV